MKRLLSAVGRETRGLHEAAYLLAALALASQLLALVRDRLLAASFGASPTLDIYYAAFRIPDLLFATVASLLSIYALMPALARLESEHPGRAIAFMRQALLAFFVGMGALSLVLFFLTPLIIRIIAPGLAADPASAAKLILLARLLLLQPILLGVSNILSNLTQIRNRFLLYSLSPLLYNLGIIFGIVALYPRFGIAGLGAGVILGALLHAAVQLPYFLQEKSDPIPLARGLTLLKEVLVLSVPRTLALAATQVSLLALVAFASVLSAGSISIFMFAYNLQAVPFTIIGVSYAIAAFPTLARLHAKGETKEFLRQIEAAVRHIIFWCTPATIFIIVLRAQIVRTILGAGQFNWTATRLTAAALALFILSLAAQSLSYLIARAYYAAGNTKKPFYFGLADIAVSIGSAVLLVFAFHDLPLVRDFVESILRVDDIPDTTVLMLALGYALGSIAEFAVGMWYFVRDFSVPTRNINRLLFQSFAASVIGGGAAYGILDLTGSYININRAISVFLQGFVAGIVGLVVTAAALVLLKNKEIAEAIDASRRKLKDIRRTTVAVEPTDIAS
ncbi:MAG: murein biosynthesis integral membrane protein MurJ [Minisyncoccia bacterium]